MYIIIGVDRKCNYSKTWNCGEISIFVTCISNTIIIWHISFHILYQVKDPNIIPGLKALRLILCAIFITPLPEGGRGYTVLPLSVRPRYFSSHFSQ